MKEKTAIPLEGTPSIVLLNNGERMTRKDALAKGYKIHGEPDAAAPDDGNATTLKAHKAWRSSVLALPEARDREAAAAEIVNTHTEHTVSVANARAFLRGLPTERTEDQPTVTTNNPDPRAARLAEIKNGMSAFNRNNGYTAKAKPAPSLADVDPTKLKRLAEIRLATLAHNGRSQEALILQNALNTHHQVGTPLIRALAQHGFDAATLLPKT